MTKEEQIKELEDKVRVTNLHMYEKEMENKYFLKGGFPAAVIAFPIGAYIGYKLGNPTAVTDFVLDTVGLGVGFSGISIGTSLLMYQNKIDTLKKLKYFLVHKGAINNGADKEINILDAKSLTREKLKEYADKGRSKVLR